jgi:hypothetical protein
MMPYINSKDGRRQQLQECDIASTAGELNYQIFYYLKHFPTVPLQIKKIAIKVFVKHFLGDSPNYQKYNDMTGCLIRCYKELKRRLAIDAKFLLEIMDSYDNEIAIYEDKKILENGDVE